MATIVVRHDRLPVTRDRLNLTAVAHQRLMLALLVIVAITAVLLARLAWMGAASGGSGPVDLTAGLPPRADIVDRHGVPLVRTMDAYSVAVRPDRLIGDPDELARKLNEIFPDTPAREFRRKLTGPGWAYLRQRALPEQVAAVNALGEIGIEFPREKERVYPQRTLAAHVLGFPPVLQDDGSLFGGMGIESAFNDRLTDPRQRGTPFALSIDARVQGVLESELYSAMVDQKAEGATGIILDATTGEVVAMASLPVFDPNKLGTDDRARANAVVQSRYELGSTFKPLTIAAAMDAGVVTSMAKRYDASQAIRVGRYSIRDTHKFGMLTVPEILVHSSNIATAHIADEMGPRPLEKLFRAVEFDRRPSIELHERARSLWPSSWGRITTMTASYGHGIAVTPLHLASAYAALVNGGIWRPATLRRLDEKSVPEGRRVITAATSARMRQLLRMIVMDGTGRSANAVGYRVGGKTGTAEKPIAGGYAKGQNVTTFAAAFPMDNPRYVMISMMDNPRGSSRYPGVRTAAYTAAPVVKRVVERIGPMLGIIPDERRDVDVSELMPLIGHKEGDD